MIIGLFIICYCTGYAVCFFNEHGRLKAQNRYLRERVKLLRMIWIHMNKPIPKTGRIRR